MQIRVFTIAIEKHKIYNEMDLETAFLQIDNLRNKMLPFFIQQCSGGLNSDSIFFSHIYSLVFHTKTRSGERVLQPGDQLCSQGGGWPQVPDSHQTGPAFL